MMRNLPMTLAALTVTLATASTWVVCASGALGNGALLFVH
jgi:hypothetical protein